MPMGHEAVKSRYVSAMMPSSGHHDEKSWQVDAQSLLMQKMGRLNGIVLHYRSTQGWRIGLSEVGRIVDDVRSTKKGSSNEEV